MSGIVHYEIYVHDSRDWILQARFASSERDTAIAEAKMMETAMQKPVKVVRDVYSLGTNISEETIVYQGRIKPGGRSPRRRAGGGGGGSQWGAPGQDPLLGPQAAQLPVQGSVARKTVDFAFRLGVVLVISLGVAVVGAIVASMLLQRYETLGMALPPSTVSLIQFIIFLLMFLLTAIPLVMLYVPMEGILGGKGKKPGSAPSGAPVDLAREPTPDDSEEDADLPRRLSNPEEVVRAALASVDGAGEAAAAAPAAAPAADAAGEGTAAAEPAAPVAAPAAGDEEKPRRKKKKKKKKVQDGDTESLFPSFDDQAPGEGDDSWDDSLWDEDDSDEEDEEDEENENPATVVLPLEQARLQMMKFLGGAISAIKLTHPQLDAYNLFGVNLYMAGACAALGETVTLTREERDLLTREAVEVIGTRPERALQLTERFDAYSNEPRYRQMITAGRAAMESMLRASGDPFMAVGGVMKDWNTPQSRQLPTSTVTILFTDMVGSTDMTHSLGDSAAQDVIRAHNFIVRAALSHHRGKEIKHTGDGIMASFDEPVDAVNASVEIQDKVAEHNRKWSKLPLHLRIGMNSGEPIVEENDYFGATVQVASRVCAIAGPGQVMMTGASFELIPASTPWRLYPHGARPLKGVKEPVQIYEVVWTDARATELAVMELEQVQTPPAKGPSVRDALASPPSPAAAVLASVGGKTLPGRLHTPGAASPSASGTAGGAVGGHAALPAGGAAASSGRSTRSPTVGPLPPTAAGATPPRGLSGPVSAMARRQQAGDGQGAAPADKGTPAGRVAGAPVDKGRG